MLYVGWPPDLYRVNSLIANRGGFESVANRWFVRFGV